MGESISTDSAQKFPLGLKVAVAYMLFSGAYSILGVLIQSTIYPVNVAVPESLLPDEDKGAFVTAYQIGYTLRTHVLALLFNIIFLLSGIALVRRKAWGRILGMWVLVFYTPFDAWDGAVGFAQGYTGAMPTPAMYVGSLVFWSCLHGTFFAMLYRRSTVLVLARTNGLAHNTVYTGFMQGQEMEYAGFWVRVGATLIDSLLIVAITFPLLFSIYGWAYFDAEKTGFIAGPADFLISWVLPAIVVILFWMQKQATPGKMAFSLRIVDASTGNKPSAGQCMGRYFAYFVSMLPLCLGIIWVAFDKRKQGWHDKLAGIVVVRSKNRGPKPVCFEQVQQEHGADCLPRPFVFRSRFRQQLIPGVGRHKAIFNHVLRYAHLDGLVQWLAEASGFRGALDALPDGDRINANCNDSPAGAVTLLPL